MDTSELISYLGGDGRKYFSHDKLFDVYTFKNKGGYFYFEISDGTGDIPKGNVVLKHTIASADFDETRLMDRLAKVLSEGENGSRDASGVAFFFDSDLFKFAVSKVIPIGCFTGRDDVVSVINKHAGELVESERRLLGITAVD
jgi:hypothetical protein